MPLDIERACFLTVKEWYYADRRDELLISRTSSYGPKSRESTDPVNAMAETYTPRDDDNVQSLPPTVRGILRLYVKDFEDR